jgi:hypothetical protein
MTPDEYLNALRNLVASGQHSAALAFADDHAGAVEPPLSIMHELSVGDVLHVAAMTTGIDEHASRQKLDEAAEVA